MTTFYSVVTFCRCDDPKVKKINVLRFLREKGSCRKCLNLSHLKVEWIRTICWGGLEPAFRVLFSAIFHGVSLGKFHQSSNLRKVAEEKL
jgi:hypothetical protein